MRAEQSADDCQHQSQAQPRGDQLRRLAVFCAAERLRRSRHDSGCKPAEDAADDHDHGKRISHGGECNGVMKLPDEVGVRNIVAGNCKRSGKH